MFDRIRYKEKAKEVYRKYTGNAVVAGIILWLFNSGSGSVEYKTQINTTTGQTSVDVWETARSAVNPILQWLPLAVGIVLVIALVLSILFIPIQSMARNYLRRLSEGEGHPDWLEVIREGHYFRLMGILFLRSAGIVIGFICLVVPGVYLSYAWRYVDQIAIDHPEYSIGEVFNASRRMTMGYKWELFIMDISFIGWSLLIGVVSVLSFGILGIIGSILLYPYMNLTDMIAYDDLKEERDNRPYREDTITIDIN